MPMLPFLVACFLLFALLFSLDDLILDLYFYFRFRSTNRSRIKIEDLDTVQPKLVAIFVAAWQEQDVIADMLHNTLTTLNYPKPFFHIFVGVYPNDTATQAAIQPLLARFKNLHMVVNAQDGPTNKANNINYLYSNGLIPFENASGLKFSVIAIHDSEDVVHPTSLKLVNYLIPKYDAVQLPVFPLQPYPTLRNFIKFLTSGTYADEFAENHFRTMVSREIGHFIVPSAGTGFFMARSAVDKVEAARGNLFSEGSLTEDYELSLYMQKIGLGVHYFLEGVARINAKGRLVNEFIATREFFPNTLHAAIKQKARWIYGIAFQAARQMHLADYDRYQEYSLIRDLKAKYGNIILVPMYLILIYVVVSYFEPLPALIPLHSMAWYFSVVLTVLAIERQIMRAIALKHVYGWRSALLSCFLPPFLPLRFTWGNIINFLATLRAWRIALFGSPKSKAKWDKTAHTYLSKELLAAYKRHLGDLLLEKNIISPAQLKAALPELKNSSRHLGEVLMSAGTITEMQLLSSLGELWGSGHLEHIGNLANPALAKVFPRALSVELGVVPLLLWQNKVLLAASQPLPETVSQRITTLLDSEPSVIFVPAAEITAAQKTVYAGKALSSPNPHKRLGELLLEKGFVDIDQLREAFEVQNETGEQLGQVMLQLGLISSAQLESVLPELEAAMA
ncbi:MAG: glycosyltransferase [Peptococcaceae bacterium]|nr:glycosyltransferase [Peptococcaceae bacterium]